LLELRNANRENLQAAAEAAPIVEQVQKLSNARDLAASPAEKFKAKLAERKEIAAKAERDQRQAERDKVAWNTAKAKAEQQSREQAERNQAAADLLKQEQAARDKAAAEQQSREQADRDQAAAVLRKQEQAARDEAADKERRAQDKGAER
jgi:colicin import membrane protein